MNILVTIRPTAEMIAECCRRNV